MIQIDFVFLLCEWTSRLHSQFNYLLRMLILSSSFKVSNWLLQSIYRFFLFFFWWFLSGTRHHSIFHPVAISRPAHSATIHSNAAHRAVQDSAVSLYLCVVLPGTIDILGNVLCFYLWNPWAFKHFHRTSIDHPWRWFKFICLFFCCCLKFIIGLVKLVATSYANFSFRTFIIC